MGKLNVLFCNHQSFPDWIGGAELVLLGLAKNMDRQRFRPLFLFNHRGLISDEAARSAIESQIIEHEMFWEFLSPGKNTRRSLKAFLPRQSSSFARMKRYLEKEEIHLILSNCIVNILPVLAAKELGVPILWLIHEIIYAFKGVAGSERRKWLGFGKREGGEKDNLRFLSEVILGYSDIAVFNSQMSRDKIFGPGFYDKRVRVIYPPIRREIFDASYPPRASLPDIPDHALVVAFLGILVRHKGAHHFIEAAHKVLRATDEVYFIIAGGSPDKSYHEDLVQRIRKMRMEERVFLKGFLKDPLVLYDRADIICMTSLYEEPFGMVMTEAMSRGKTVLAYESGSVRETIAHGVNGYIVPRGDIDALSKQIVFLAKNRNLLTRTGEEARNSSVERYSPYRYQGEIETILEHVVEKRR